MNGKMIKRPYRVLADFEAVYRFMTEIYEPDWRNGHPAAFFEYSQMLYWTDHTQDHRNGVWWAGDEVVGFCWYESAPGDVWCSLRPGFEALAPELIDHAEARLRDASGRLRFHFVTGQTALNAELERRGYRIAGQEVMGILDFAKTELGYTLPEGFRFVQPEEMDAEKFVRGCWRGFGNTGEPDGGVEREIRLYTAPHATSELNLAVENERGEYVCCAGMWMLPENHLAYLEPLCTVPECRGKGLAAAVLTELMRRTKALGATHMTGGDDPFYFKIGYEPRIRMNVWEKTE